MKQKQNKNSGIFLLLAIFLNPVSLATYIFLYLKLSETFNLSWWAVASPYIVTIVIAFILWCVDLIRYHYKYWVHTLRLRKVIRYFNKLEHEAPGSYEHTQVKKQLTKFFKSWKIKEKK